MHDIAGDVVALCDLNGPPGAGQTEPSARVVAQWTYDPYGQVLTAEHLHDFPSRRVGHKGLFVDDLAEDFSIYHNRNRTYMPKYGRFAQRDPHAMGGPVLGQVAYGGRALDGPWPEEMSLEEHFGDGMNTFAYLASNPLLAEDPLGLFLPGPSDFITGMLEALVTDYAANMEWDADWAQDWSMDEYAHTRMSDKWVFFALGWGTYDAFDIFGYNPLDSGYDALFGGTKKYRPPNAPRPQTHPGRHTSGNGPYKKLKDEAWVGPGKPFTRGQKEKIFYENSKNNNGRLRSDITGRYLSRSPGSPNSAQVDHILPKSRGGSNSYSNAQVVEAYWNQSKGNRH